MAKSQARFRIAAAILATLSVPTVAGADALIDNVSGVTLDANKRVVRFRAMVIDAQGRVVRLIPVGEKTPEPTRKNPGPRYDWRADLKGRTLVPGMIDAHGHIMELGFRALELDLSDTKSLAEAQAKIAAYIKANPDRRWIVGGGWNQEVWGLGRFPTAAELDAVTGDLPVWLARADGHAAWANSAAMKAAGVTAATPTPAGGRIEKVGGRPSGVFVDAAMDLVRKVVPQPLGKDRNAAFIRAQDILLSNGVTAAADMGTSLDDWLTYRRIGDRGDLRVRIMSYGMGVDTAVQIGGTGPSPWLYDGRLRLVGVKLYADGALGSRGAWLKAPYADAPGQSGAGFMSDTLIRNLMSRAAMDNYQVAVHAIGDRANAQVLGAIEELSDTYKGDRRWRIEHAQIVDPVDLPRFGRHGIIASMQPVHETSDRVMAAARLGPQRLGGAYAWASMLRNGAGLAFGSDYPVEAPDPWAGWAAAITRQGPDGQPFGGWQPQEAVTREQAWWAYTGGAAYAGFAEKDFGSLQPGQKADFVVVDRDPMNASPTELRGTKVLETWIGAQKVWERK